MTVAQHRITAEELLAMPNDQPCELIAGEIVMMTPAGGDHCEIAARIHLLIGSHVMKNKLGVTYISDPGFVLARVPDTVRAPDVAFVGRERVQRTPKYIPGAPDLAVEVISPSDSGQEVEAKAQAWLNAGTAMVWVVSPEFRSVAVYRRDKETLLLHEKDVISGQDILSGFECSVAEFFAE